MFTFSPHPPPPPLYPPDDITFLFFCLLGYHLLFFCFIVVLTSWRNCSPKIRCFCLLKWDYPGHESCFSHSSRAELWIESQMGDNQLDLFSSVRESYCSLKIVRVLVAREREITKANSSFCYLRRCLSLADIWNIQDLHLHSMFTMTFWIAWSRSEIISQRFVLFL